MAGPAHPGHAGPAPFAVTRGPDPRVHLSRMDARIKSGHDD